MRWFAKLLIALSAVAGVAPLGTAQQVEFERHIAPILVRHCVGCHNGSAPAGGLDLTRRATARAGGESQTPAIVPGDAQASHALQRIRSGEMPPEGKGRPLAAAELRDLEAWITAGAEWPEGRVLGPFEFTTEARAGFDWWSLKNPVRPVVPVVQAAARAINPVDNFVLAKLEQQGLSGSPETDRATFIRRATLDLHGLPPSPDEIEAFVADPSPEAHARLVDRLLASPRYGERWARHWLDVVRFGESNGYETNTARPNAWPYRDWVIAALNDDLPYPRFIAEQLAGDQLGVDAATGFLVGGAHDSVGSPDVELTLQQRANDLDDMLSTTAGAFLGLTVNCAKCHDHKFDPITQRDYYALQAMLAGVQHAEREWRNKDTPQRKRDETAARDELLAIERAIQEQTTAAQPLAQVGAVTGAASRPPVNPRLNVDRFAPRMARFVRFTVLATSGGEPCIDELEVLTAGEAANNVALSSRGAKASASSVFARGTSQLHRLEHLVDGRFGNARSWISAESGAGWVQVELSEPATIDRVVWARDREGTFRDRLATRYRIEVSGDAIDWQVVADSDDRAPWDTPSNAAAASAGLPDDVARRLEPLRSQATALRARLAKLAPPAVYAGTFKQPDATHVLYRGEPMQQREIVAPGAIGAVGPPLNLADGAPEADRRLALAGWIGSPQNPLTARVMVNRLWHYHFGRGLVPTPSDFGFGGGLPSHPELLDWLATEFIASGWRPKAIHRLIMLSATYRQASGADSTHLTSDAQNHLLWRFAPRRLEAEAIRDAMLWTSGVLDLGMGGPGYDAFEPSTNYVKVYVPKRSFGRAEWRRMVYQEKPRLRQDATFGEFDCPDSTQAMARRNVSTTALQSLNLLNGPFVMQQSRLFAERLTRDAGAETEAQVARGFRLAFGRAADAEELAAGTALVRGQGLLVFCRALLNANEFLYFN